MCTHCRAPPQAQRKCSNSSSEVNTVENEARPATSPAQPAEPAAPPSCRAPLHPLPAAAGALCLHHSSVCAEPGQATVDMSRPRRRSTLALHLTSHEEPRALHTRRGRSKPAVPILQTLCLPSGHTPQHGNAPLPGHGQSAASKRDLAHPASLQRGGELRARGRARGARRGALHRQPQRQQVGLALRQRAQRSLRVVGGGAQRVTGGAIACKSTTAPRVSGPEFALSIMAVATSTPCPLVSPPQRHIRPN